MKKKKKSIESDFIFKHSYYLSISIYLFIHFMKHSIMLEA